MNKEKQHLLPHKIEDYPFYKRYKGKDFLFFHIPKTGGTSINRVFGFQKPNPDLGIIRKHFVLFKIKPLVNKTVWDNAFKFCFVRNPWDRIYSHYRYRLRKKKFEKTEHYDSFEKWLFFHLAEGKKISNLRPQLEWIEDNNGDVDLDFIGRFENLNEDFQKICEINNLKLILPHFNKSVLDFDYRIVFNKEMIELVAEVYKKDISYFNYSFL